MSWYSRYVFPRLCDLLLSRPQVARRRRDLLVESSGEVLEIGFGTGLNLPHYPDAVKRLVAVDPNVGMQARARARIARSRLEVDVRASSGERLPFDDERFDCVVSTFTLCSVGDAERTLDEAYRVLKPGGRFLFLEHGLSAHPGVRRWQRRLNWLEMRLADGCRLDRDVPALVTARPFTSFRIEPFVLAGAPRTHGSMAAGIATK